MIARGKKIDVFVYSNGVFRFLLILVSFLHEFDLMLVFI